MFPFFFIIFLLSAFFLIHSYVLYPLSVFLLSFLYKKKFNADPAFQPKISIIISAFNEEKVIENTIRNFLNMDYDNDKIEIIIGSDNSEDNTNNIVENLSKEIPQIKFFPFNKRRGKSQVLNDLVEKSSSEILIFSDANTLYHKSAIKNLVKYYYDKRVGGVSGKLILVKHKDASETASSEKTYWDLETLLKEKEGKLGVLIGANGGIYSIRKKYFEKIPIEFPIVDDFYISLKILEKKYAFLYISDSKAEEFVAPGWKSEFVRKIRNNSNALSTIKAIKKLLNPLYGLVSYGLWSHKIIRWFTPLILIFLFISNLFLISVNFFILIIFCIQVLFYVFALIGYILDLKKIYNKIFFLCFYFVMTNIAMLIGIYRFVINKQTNFWQSTARVNE